jgi:microcompartment protein CcmK/EutM
MLLGRVVGTVVATRKEPSMEGLKFLLVKRLDSAAGEMEDSVVAADGVGAGVGEVVLYATGSAARQTIATHERPCDAVIMAIVDSWAVGGREVYSKGDDE